MTTAQIVIYTDGACDPNPGPGGWACILKRGAQEKILTGSEHRTTNNRMELTAALRAIQSLTSPTRVEIHTDSEYLQRGITEWMPAWKARDWKRKGGVLANVDLWQALDAAIAPHEVSWRWVRGHASSRDNRRADALARRAVPR